MHLFPSQPGAAGWFGIIFIFHFGYRWHTSCVSGFGNILHSSCVCLVGHGSPAVPLLDSRFLCLTGIGHSFQFYRHVSRGVHPSQPGAAGCSVIASSGWPWVAGRWTSRSIVHNWLGRKKLQVICVLAEEWLGCIYLLLGHACPAGQSFILAGGHLLIACGVWWWLCVVVVEGGGILSCVCACAYLLSRLVVTT